MTGIYISIPGQNLSIAVSRCAQPHHSAYTARYERVIT